MYIQIIKFDSWVPYVKNKKRLYRKKLRSTLSLSRYGDIFVLLFCTNDVMTFEEAVMSVPPNFLSITKFVK